MHPDRIKWNRKYYRETTTAAAGEHYPLASLVAIKR